MKYLVWILLFSIGLPVYSAAKVKVSDVNHKFDKTAFLVNVKTASEVDTNAVKVEYINQTVQLDIPGLYLENGK